MSGKNDPNQWQSGNTQFAAFHRRARRNILPR